ncbi:hypothetical protein PanWU01x14_049780, partial [Parasponia andersonii]
VDIDKEIEEDSYVTEVETKQSLVRLGKPFESFELFERNFKHSKPSIKEPRLWR